MPMPQPHSDLAAWIDTETTGLDPATGSLLEIAVVVTDNDLELVADPLSIVVKPIRADWREQMQERDGFVWKMHSENGLIDAIESGEGLDLADADAMASAYLRSLAGDWSLVLGGNSITFDREWMKMHAPLTFQRLHYRSIDMTSVWMFAERVIGLSSEPVEKAGGHRALGDLYDSIAQARFWKQAIAGAADAR